MHVVILAIGDELVLGQTVDTNSAHLSAKLAARGLLTRFHQTVADDREAIRDAFLFAAREGDLIIASGGLGPTDDDLTRFALADALGVSLVLHQPSITALNRFFKDRGRDMPERNRVQAMIPATAQAIENTCGTAPGIKATLHGVPVYVTPGVPKEMFAMFERDIEPELGQLTGDPRVIRTTRINTFGLGESHLAEKIGDLMDRTRNPRVGTTVAGGYVSIRIRSEFPDATQAQQKLDETCSLVEQRLGSLVFGRDETDLQTAVVQMLAKHHRRIATAESCTGGMLGMMITDVPGSSDVYLGGWITYTNDMKSNELGVDRALLKSHGAVSEPVAQAMAEHALKKSGADLAVSLTGIAGPEGGTADKPVGTVWLGLSERINGKIDTQTLQFSFPGDREMIRDRSAKSALQAIRFTLMDEPLDILVSGGKLRC